MLADVMNVEEGVPRIYPSYDFGWSSTWKASLRTRIDVGHVSNETVLLCWMIMLSRATPAINVGQQ